MGTRPFSATDYLSGGDIRTLADWLRENVPATTALTEGYSVRDLANDLDKIAEGVWSESIDAERE